jgi:hypothetical protein
MHVAQKQGQMQGSTGNFAHTVSGFSSSGDMRAVLGVSNRNGAVLDTNAETGVFAFGGADSSSNMFGSTIYIRDAQTLAASADTGSLSVTTGHVHVSTGAGVDDAEVAFSAFATDGATLNQTDVGGSNYYFSSILISGADVTSHIGQFTSSATQDAATNVTWTNDFSPDFILMWHSTTGSDAVVSYGGCQNDGGTLKNRSVSFYAKDNTSPSDYCSLADDTRAMIRLGSSVTIAAIEVTSMTLAGGGFTVATRDHAVAMTVSYLAIKLNPLQKLFFDFVSFTTGTGVKGTNPTAGFAGKFAMMFMTRCATLGTIEADADAGTLAISLMDWQSSGHSSCYAFCADEGVTYSGGTPSDSKSLASADAIKVNSDTGTVIAAATKNDFNANGPRYNFTTNSITSKQCLLFFVGNDRIGGTGSVSFSGSATLKGRGKLAGTGAVAFSGSAVTKGRGKLVGTGTVAFSGSTLTKGRGKLAGTGAVAFSGSTLTKGRGKLVGTGSAAFSGSGTAKGRGKLLGTGAVAFSGSAVSHSRGKLAGTGSAAFSGSGLIKGRGKLAGTANPAFSGAGTLGSLNSSANMEGTCFVSFSGSSTAKGRGKLQGTGAVAFSGSGTPKARGKLAGAGAVAFSGSATGALKAKGSGTSQVAFSGSAVTHGHGKLAGTGAVAFSGTGTGRSAKYASGTCSVAFSGSGTARARGKLLGTGTAAFSGSGTARGHGKLAGTGAVAFSGSGRMGSPGSMFGTGSVAFSGTGVARGRGRLEGTGASAFSGTGLATPRAFIRGTGSAAFSGSGTARAKGKLEGTGFVTFSGSATFAPIFGPWGTVLKLARTRLHREVGLAFTVPILWDNEPEAVGEYPLCIVAHVVGADHEQIDTGSARHRYRKGGWIELAIRARLGKGEKDALLLSDRVRSALLEVSEVSGLNEMRFRQPSVLNRGRERNHFVIRMRCPFYADFPLEEAVA